MFQANDSLVSETSNGGLSIAIDTNQYATSFRYRRATEIYGENEPAEYVYQVAVGAVRSYKLLSDGRRQIGAFHLAGDVFGFENGPVHRFTAEAIVDTRLRLMKRSRLENAANGDSLLVHNLLELTARNLRHAEDHMLLLGRKNAIERVATFLLEMDRRQVGFLSLPMSRRDIADYLGLTLETVSRVLSHLESRRAIAFVGPSGRQISLLNRKQLGELDA